MVQTYETDFFAPIPQLIFAGSTLTELTEEACKTLALEEFADMLRLWDADQNDWVKNSPIVVRLTSVDLVAYTTQEDLMHVFEGVVNTNQPFFYPVSPDEEHLFVWKSDPEYAEFFGDIVEMADVCNCADHGFKFMDFAISEDRADDDNPMIRDLAIFARKGSDPQLKMCIPMYTPPRFRNNLRNK